MYNSLDEMDKDERSLLLFLETQATDYGGLVDARHMNDEDMRIVEQWWKTDLLNLEECALKMLKD